MKYINKTHSVELYVNGESIEFFSQEKLNLRFNSVFANPTKIQTTSAEYSFTFTLPITEKNNKIFDFANVPSKRNKFNKRYPTTVAVDGILIFNGEIIVSSVDAKGYNCNLYINRLNTVETIFGDSLMTDIDGWEIDYHQDSTINEYNNKTDISYPQDCFFPLISYGMFQKNPTSGGTYTLKHTIDEYNRFYNESFYPSINLLKLVKKCFEHKGYEVTGDIFDDEVARHIFTSTSLADGQDPKYNYGLDEIGKLNVGFNFNSVNGTISTDGVANVATYVPYSVGDDMMITIKDSYGGEGNIYEYNNIYDIWSQKSDFLSITGAENKNLWRENMIVAPIDGYYKIKMNYEIEIPSTFTQYPCYTYERNNSSRSKAVEKVSYTPLATFEDHWTELQLVRNNSDENCGMITPTAIGGDVAFSRQSIPSGAIGNSIQVYPQEALSLNDGSITCYSPKTATSVLAFDPRVNKNFVIGQCASDPYYFPAVIKNGRSWDSSCAEENKSRYNCDGYRGWSKEWKTSSSGRGGAYAYTSSNTDYNKNTLNGSSISVSVSSSKKKVTGNIEAIVFLKKNDYLQLKLIQRHWVNKKQDDVEGDDETIQRPSARTSGRINTTTEYMTDAQVKVTGNILFQAYAPDTLSISNDSAFNFGSDSKFSKKLDLSEFLNKDEKMADFINNFIREFNLSYSQSNKVITLNKQKINMNADKRAINLTDRVSDDDYTLEEIDFPSKMYVAYTIADDERGMYTSAEKNATDEQIQSNNWLDYADRGYDKVEMMEDEYASEESATTKTSYNWYEDFHISYDNQNADISIPIQAKDEWMIEGYKNEEMMKKDGYGLKRRYWFPSGLTTNYVSLLNNPSRKVYIYLCKSIYDGCELSYKVPGGSTSAQETLLTRYFNVFFDCDTNYLTFDAYLTTDEYLAIKNGCNIVVDDDVYIVTEIEGYDVSGHNTTKITAIKK